MDARSPRRFLTLLAALAVAFLTASCDYDGLSISPERVTEPQATVVTAGEEEATYTHVKERLPDGLDLSLSRVIGPDGGVVNLAGHRLTVPAGAVDEPTLFILRLVTEGYVEVRLQAFKLNILGLPGTRLLQFNEGKPVTLALSYARATNIDRDSPPDLKILRLLGDSHDGEHEVLESSMDAPGRIVITELDGFSRFCMAY